MPGRVAKPVEERFWANVKKTDPDKCWLWTGERMYHPVNKTPSYGRFFMRKGLHTGAHRASWMIHFGDIPEGMQVLHNCDNPQCVNPSHLRLGTIRDNMREMFSKGRANRACGERASKHKLTAEQVKEILKLEGTMTHREIGSRYGVSQTSISLIFKGKNWKHIPRE